MHDNRIRQYPIRDYLPGNPKKQGNTWVYNPCPLCGHNDCFKVFIDTNMFECFSCGKKGNIYHLAIAQGHGSNVREAAEYLAKALNIEEAKPEVKLKTSEVFQSAMMYYKDNLSKSKYAMEYLTEIRKRSLYLIDELNYGYSEGSGLYQYLAKSFSDKDIASTGLIIFHEKYKAELFKKGYIVYPEMVAGKCVDFFAKPIEKSEKAHPIQIPNEYKQGGHGFYGFDAMKEKTFILVEGQEDRNSIMECGGYDVAATCGNISSSQIHQIQVYGKGKTIYCCFDNDEPGRGYADRILLELGNVADVRIISFPAEFNDIDDYLKSVEYNAASFESAYRNTAQVKTEQAVNSDYPFTKLKGCSLLKDSGEKAFNFDTVTCSHKIILDDKNYYGVFLFSGNVTGAMIFNQVHLNDTNTFIKHLLSNFIDESGEMLDTIQTSSDKIRQETYIKLRNYMIKQYKECEVHGAIRNGIGNVSKPDIDSVWSKPAQCSNLVLWNYGNIVAMRYKDKDGVRQYKEMPATTFPVLNNKVFELSDTKWLDNGFGAVHRDKLKSALLDLIKYYQGTAGKLLGWAVACSLHKQNRNSEKKTPMLFLWGDTKKGKSSAISIIHALFGLYTNYASGQYYTVGVRAGTTNYYDVILSDTPIGLHGIPFMFDEADKDEKGEPTQKHFANIIGLYEGIGKGRSTRDAKSVTKSVYNTVMVLGSPTLPDGEQYINRCVLIDMKAIDISKPGFETFLKNRSHLSGFALEVLKHIDFKMFDAKYNEIKPQICKNMDSYNVDTRQLHLNTMCKTGYALLVEAGIVPDFMTEADWQGQIDTSMKEVQSTSPSEALFNLLISLVGTREFGIDWGEYLYLRHFPLFGVPYSELVVNIKYGSIWNILKTKYSNTYPMIKSMSTKAIMELFESLPSRDLKMSPQISWFPAKKEYYGNGSTPLKEMFYSYTTVWNNTRSMSKPAFVDKDPTLKYLDDNGNLDTDNQPEKVKGSGVKQAWLFRFENPHARGGELPKSEYDGGGQGDGETQGEIL